MKIFRDIDELNERLKQLDHAHLHQDQRKPSNRNTHKSKTPTFVFTNGVFDILHGGHVDLLEFAKNSGDYLIIGINDDNSVKRLKGDSRPVYPLDERMEVLEALMFTDFIIPFSEDTPLQLIRKLYRVDVLVKGGDYKPHEVVGKEEVEKSGGKLLLFDFKTPSSTTSLLKKIKK